LYSRKRFIVSGYHCFAAGAQAIVQRGKICDRNGEILAGEGMASSIGFVPGKMSVKEKRCNHQKTATLLIQYSMLFWTFIRPLFRRP